MSLPDQDAPLELTVGPGGRLVCRLPDHRGRLWPYEVRRVPGGADFVHLEKQCAPRRVRKPPGRLADCSCPWWNFQGRARCLACKHMIAYRRLTQTFVQETATVAAPKKPADEQAPAAHAPGVYAAIARVARDLASAGIAKSSVNEGQRFHFRGIDAVMNALATPLVNAGLLILPRVLSRQQSERPSNKGGTLICVSVEVAYDFVCVADGSTHVVVMHGEAMDSGDKATNKALSAAYKYACFQAFCIPTESADDADAHSPEPAPQPTATVVAGGRHVSGPAPTAPPAARISQEQIGRIESLAGSKGYTERGLLAKIKTKYGAERLGDLTAAQADEVEAALAAAPKAKAS